MGYATLGRGGKVVLVAGVCFVLFIEDWVKEWKGVERSRWRWMYLLHVH